MQKLDSILSFTPPTFTPEQREEMNRRSEEYDRRERDVQRRLRIESAGIPARYKNARIDLCEQKAQAWAKAPTLGLILCGDVGRGKTYTACAILCECARERTVRFMTVDSFITEIQSTFDSHESTAKAMGAYKNASILAIDDFGKEKLTEWSLSKVFEVIKHRDENGKPTIITTNCGIDALISKMTPGQDNTTAQTIASRFRQYDLLRFTGEDRRLN